MATLLADNAYGTLAVGLAAGDTALSFTAGHGARFPAVTAPDVLYCCILNTSNILEEVQITAHTANADSCTIVRAQGGTTAKVWNTGDRIEARVSKTVLQTYPVATILGGAAGAIVCQVGTSTTSFSALGTAADVLLSGGTGVPTWGKQNTLVVGSAANATNATTSASCSGNAATVTTNANLTGPITSVGNATALAQAAAGNSNIATIPLSLIASGYTNSAVNGPFESSFGDPTGNTPVELGNCRIQNAGTYRVSFWLHGGGTTTAYGQIYKNGSALGTLRANGTSNYVEYTEDLSFAAGDTCQLFVYCSASSATGNFKNFGFRITANSGVHGPSPLDAGLR